MGTEVKLKVVQPSEQLQFDFSKVYGAACADKDIRAVKSILKGLAELGTEERVVNTILTILCDSNFGVASALEALKKP